MKGELAFGTIDSWLVWNLTRGAAHVTDPSNASRTLLFDIRKGDWDDELLALFDIPRGVLPRVVPSSAICGLLSTQQVRLASIVCKHTHLRACQNGAFFVTVYETPGAQ